ncbi:MAG: SpoIVB peptidase [Clostridia bacterium]|nr:SpoIVB peptidase [Clostridia bacterium]
MKHASPLRRATGVVLALFLALGYFSPVPQTLRALPDTLALTQGQIQTLRLPQQLRLSATGNLAVAASEDETLQLVSQTAGASELLLSLMGVIPLKKVEVNISPEKRLIPGGAALGVAMRTDGVLVVGTGDLSEAASPATLCGIRPGDVLRTVNGVRIVSSQQLTELIAQLGEKPLPVEYAREGTVFTTTMTPKMDASTGTVRIGAWVRDSTAGVGTLSFYDPETGRYAALGHAITDGDTGQVLTVSQGQILKADVVAVQRGQKGVPGELKGSFLMDPVNLGDIRKNTVLGIYGAMKQPPVNALYPEGLPIGLRSGVHEGPATILSTVDGTGVQAFTVEITRVNQQSAPAPKSMVLKVTDPRLLAATGGIVQGMSGSPIIQDGRLIGAVTHVFVSDPTQGYGLYVDWMLQEAECAK